MSHKLGKRKFRQIYGDITRQEGVDQMVDATNQYWSNINNAALGFHYKGEKFRNFKKGTAKWKLGEKLERYLDLALNFPRLPKNQKLVALKIVGE
uniref:Uncharacterized protein n=1 Tax=Pseudomonas phage RVTF4 TaxID=3236931 RepID=A0AB39CCZ4_9VIRU